MNTPPTKPLLAEETAEDRLRRENEDLRKELQQLKGRSFHAPQYWQPSRHTIWAIILGITVLVIIAFFAGFIPLRTQRSIINSEAQQREQALPRVRVIRVARSSQESDLDLPGSIQPITESPILARANGYIKRRLVDIGDRVKANQPVAEIEAPELDQDVSQSKAALEEAKASLDEALANYEQGKANLELARTTAQRWANLVKRGVVSRQDNDSYQTQYQAQISSVRSLEQTIAARRSSIAAAAAGLARLEQMRDYRVVRAPFDGVVTLRNIDTGTLVTSGSTLLFRVAQTNKLRTYVNVPQATASSILPGQEAQLRVSNIPGRIFAGNVARTSNSLDPNSRTLLVEVHVPNPDGALLPGMYARVSLKTDRSTPPLLVPADALVVLPEGTEVATLRPDHTVHLQKIELGRDYGDRLEIIDGLKEGDVIIPSPGDLAREGLRIDPIQ